MNNQRFYLVLTISALLLLLVVSVMFFFEYKNLRGSQEYGKNNKDVKENKFPPSPSRCPDYWKVKDPSEGAQGCSHQCENVKNIGQCNLSQGNKVMCFDKEPFKGKDGPEKKCLWAKQCQVPWEGIDNLC